MDRFLGTIRANKKSDLYVLDTDVPSISIRSLVEELGYNFFYIDGEQITSEKEFLAVARVNLRFPEYSGHGWDALFDNLRDWSWIPPGLGDVLLYDNFQTFARGDPDGFRLALEVLRDAATLRNDADRPIPLYVLLRGNGELPPEIPVFDE